MSRWLQCQLPIFLPVLHHPEISSSSLSLSPDQRHCKPVQRKTKKRNAIQRAIKNGDKNTVAETIAVIGVRNIIQIAHAHRRYAPGPRDTPGIEKVELKIPVLVAARIAPGMVRKRCWAFFVGKKSMTTIVKRVQIRAMIIRTAMVLLFVE